MSGNTNEYEHFNYDQDNIANKRHSGENKTRAEVQEHTNSHDPSHHTLKTLTKLQNTEQKEQSTKKQEHKDKTIHQNLMRTQNNKHV